MNKGILVDTCSYFKLSCCFNNLVEFEIVINDEKYKIYLSEELVYELENNHDKFQSKNKYFKIPTIKKVNKFKCSSKEKFQISDKLALVEYETLFHNFRPPLSIIDKKLIAYQLVFPDDIIILSDDRNLIHLANNLQCKTLETPQFQILCIEQGLIDMNNLKECRKLLISINEYPKGCDALLKKSNIFI